MMYHGLNHDIGKDLSIPPAKLSSAEEAIAKFVRPKQRVYIHMGMAAPTQLLTALAKNEDLHDITTVNMSFEGPAPHLAKECANRIRAMNLFIGGNSRQAVDEQRADFVPVFFSEVPSLFRNGVIPIDVALVQVSPPDRHGWCSLGVSVDCSLAAVQTAKYVICQINPNMPRTHGDGLIHVNHMDAIIEVDDPLPELHYKVGDKEDEAIGRYVASLIPDGATLQMGIGTIPNAVLGQLTGHKNLGIHTEMFSDGVIPLLEKGVITNSHKKVLPGKMVSTFLMGSRKLYEFVDDNPSVLVNDVSIVNDPSYIRLNPKVHAINSAIEVDLTGQVCADSIGTRMFSGIGGQMDFMRGASLSPGGKPIIALPSQTSKGESRIVPTLKPGAGVVTTRAHVHYVVTEYGIAHLHGKSIRERAIALAQIAHPNHRDSLFADIAKRFGKFGLEPLLEGRQ